MKMHQHVLDALSLVLLVVLLVVLFAVIRLLWLRVLRPRLYAAIRMGIARATRAAPTSDVLLQQHSLTTGARAGP